MLNYDHHPHHRCFAYLNTHQTIYEAAAENIKMTRFLIRKTMPILYASIVFEAQMVIINLIDSNTAVPN